VSNVPIKPFNDRQAIAYADRIESGGVVVIICNRCRGEVKRHKVKPTLAKLVLSQWNLDNGGFPLAACQRCKER